MFRLFCFIFLFFAVPAFSDSQGFVEENWQGQGWEDSQYQLLPALIQLSFPPPPQHAPHSLPPHHPPNPHHHPHSHPPYYPVPPVIVPPPPVAVCPLYQGSACYTYSGNICPLLAPYYQSPWFNSCAYVDDSFQLCVTVPSMAPPVYGVRPVCGLQGAPCVCSFGFWNGYNAYEPGQVF